MPSTLFTPFSSFSIGVFLHFLSSPVSAALPFNSEISSPVLKKSNEASFDPLGVAAVLYNPRAEVSAARLYTQPDRIIFRWPHTMMIGGTLTPLSTLVDYLTSRMSSVDPAVSVCLKDRTMLPVRSTMVFPELPVSLSNAWLRDILAFKPSPIPENDFAIAGVEGMFVQPSIKPSKAIESLITADPVPRFKSEVPLFTVLDLLGYICGLLIFTGLVFSVLTGDVWAITLFATYSLHWVASTIVSYYPLAKIQDNKIVSSASIEHCVYQRPEGGTVIFRGRKDTLERWARTTWKFDDKPYKHFLHWFWTITGSLAAVASVACMVNMAATLQLGFLGLLVYSSLAEIAGTQIARKLQGEAHRRTGGRFTMDPTILRNNQTRSMGIIRATLMCQLNEDVWFKLKLLPEIVPFQRMMRLLEEVKNVDNETEMRRHVQIFREEFGIRGHEDEKEKYAGDSHEDKQKKLAQRIAGEIEEAWMEVKSQAKEV